MIPRTLHRGDHVIFVKQKCGTRPALRAVDVAPAPMGDTYSYHVEKLWTVEDVLPDGRLVLHTRRHKQHVVAADDPNLRWPRWWERLRYWHRFPELDDAQAPPESPEPPGRPEP